MEYLFEKLLQAFSVEFMFTITFTAYFTIKLLEFLTKGKVASWVKKLSTVIVGGVSFGVFSFITDTPKETLITSYLGALFAYDYAIKWLLGKFNANYK